MVCAVQGICTAGAFYFLNEADVVICSPDATFFDSHVTYGLVSALEPVGLMRRVGLAETLRIALMGNDERVTAETALRISLVTEIVARDALWDRAHEIAAGIARKPKSATQGTVRAIWESLDKPYRAAMLQNLIYTRLGNPIGQAEIAEHGPDRPEPRLPVTDVVRPELSRRIADVLALDATAPAFEFQGTWHTWGELAATADAVAPHVVPGARVGLMLRNRPAHIGLLLGLLRAGACDRRHQPRAGRRPRPGRPGLARRADPRR